MAVLCYSLSIEDLPSLENLTDPATKQNFEDLNVLELV